jgi:hypothetical protein
MTEYFAVLGDNDRRGPFASMHEPVELLKQASRDRGDTEEQAQHFFLNQSAVEEVVTVDGKTECFRLGWLAREKAGRDEESSSEDLTDIRSHDEIDLNREYNLADAHFNITARKAIEVNEGGLVDPKVP